MAHERSEASPAEAPSQTEAVREPSAPGVGVQPGAPLTPAAALMLQRAAGNAAVARLVAGERGQAPPLPPPPPSPPAVARAPRRRAPARSIQRSDPEGPYPVIPEMLEDDKTRRWWDPADKTAKPVWTAEGGYAKNPSARPLKDLVSPKGRIGGGFENGVFTYVVDAKGDVVIAKRLGEPGGAPGRATGMPHPTLIGGKDPTVLAAGEVEIRGGKIYRVDNQSGHFRPPRKAMGQSLKGFMRIPTSAFHPEFHAQSVHYDALGTRTTKPFRSLKLLKLKARDFSTALKGLNPRSVAGKFKSKRFRSRAKGVGAGLAGALVTLALSYLLSKLTAWAHDRWIKSSIERLAPKVEEKLQQRSEQLEKLLEADSEADVYVNAQFAITYVDDISDEDDESYPAVDFHDAGFSREPWDPTPIETTEIHCATRFDTTIVTASEKFSPAELFEPPPVEEEEKKEDESMQDPEPATK